MVNDMGFRNNDEYREYANTLSDKDLHDILRNISKEHHPEGYRIIARLAKEKRDSGAVILAYPKGAILIRNIYIGLLLLLAFSVFVNLLAEGDQAGRQGILMLMLNAIVFGSIVAGIHLVKPWVVTLVLWFSYLTLARLVLVALSGNANTPPGHPASTLLYAVFCAYQIAIFSSATTKKFFKHRGTDII